MFQDKGAWSADAAHAPFGAVTLSATQTEETEPLVGYEDYAHPILGPRLKQNKPAELLKSDAKMEDPAFAEEFVTKAWALSKTGGGALVPLGGVNGRRRFGAVVCRRSRVLGAC